MMEITDKERLTHAARKAGGEDNMLFELAAAQLYERGVEIKLECLVCGHQWEPGGLSDSIGVPVTSDGAMCAAADYFASIGIKVPRALLLDCPSCMDMGPEYYACSRRRCPPDCPLC